MATLPSTDPSPGSRTGPIESGARLPPATSLRTRNVAAMGSEIALFMVAMGLLGQHTFVPLFVSKLSDSPLAVGAVMAAFQIGWLPQVFVAGYVERSARKWPWVVVFGGLERFPSLGLALCALAATTMDATMILVMVCVLCFAQFLCGGLATTPWLDVMARAVPPRWRAQFLGVSTVVGTLLVQCHS